MSDDNSMDVDDHVPRTPPRSIVWDTSQSAPTSPSSLSLPQAQVKEFENQMRRASEGNEWSDRLIRARNDRTGLLKVLESVLLYLSPILRGTPLEKNVIPLPTSMPESTALVQSLNDNEVEECKTLVLNGNWVGLLTHRMHLARFRRRSIVM